MSHYFIAGNIWLVFAVLAVVGRKVERHQPDTISFFGLGRWFSPREYNLFVGVLLGIAAVCFILSWWNGRRTRM
jgi:hypothetical protein